MMEGEKQNANPTIYLPDSSALRRKEADLSRLDLDDSDVVRDEIDAAEIFDLIRHVNDPEHPLTLEQLKVATLDQIDVSDEKSTVDVLFTPTIPHCSMATLIGLCIRVKLLRSLPPRFKCNSTTQQQDCSLHAEELHALHFRASDCALAAKMQDVQDITLGVKREAVLTIDASLAPQKRLKRNLTQEQDSKSQLPVAFMAEGTTHAAIVQLVALHTAAANACSHLVFKVSEEILSILEENREQLELLMNWCDLCLPANETAFAEAHRLKCMRSQGQAVHVEVPH
eukprot:5301-Heterococcus_DN1.PRE.3